MYPAICVRRHISIRIQVARPGHMLPGNMWCPGVNAALEDWWCTVPVHGKTDGQPDGRRVADGRQVLGQTIVDETPGVRDVVGSTLQSVEVDVAGQRPQPGQHVRLRHAHQDQVGRRTHGASGSQRA